MRNGAKVMVREAVHYGHDGAVATAPAGEYTVEPNGECVGLCKCGGECNFTLSFDAFQQLLVEGRIAVRG